MEDKEILEEDYSQYEEDTEQEELEEKVESKNSEPKAQASTYFEKTIKEYLDTYAMRDEAFKERYQNKDKSITGCCNYIINTVRSMGVNGLADEEVYKLARDYYVDDIDKKLEQASSGKVVVNHTIELTEEEKLKARVEAMKKLEEEILQEERKKREADSKAQAKAEEKARKQEEARIKKEEEKKAQEEKAKAEALANGAGEQMSIFDMFGE